MTLESQNKILPPHLDYAYTHSQTQGTTGYFSCEPPQSLSLEQALDILEAAPLDDFLHQHLLRLLSKKSMQELRALALSAYDQSADVFCKPALAALLAECALLLPELAPACVVFPADTAQRLFTFSPAIYLRAVQLPDATAAAAWNRHFYANICEHHPLPRSEEVDVPLLFSQEECARALAAMQNRAQALARLHAVFQTAPGPAWERPPAQETALRALDALMEAQVLDGAEMRHEASLSPIALLRPWQVDISVQSGLLRHSLRGMATAYGRGLSLAQARASYAMEIVERASAYVSVVRLPENPLAPEAAPCCGEISLRSTPLPVRYGRFADVQAQGLQALDPELLPLEAPGTDAALHWVPARDPLGSTVWVPAQAVFLFCNLDEPSLFLAGGSTGLASGNTLEEAKVAALTEIIERDAEATTPFSRARCFHLQSREPRVQGLLDDYAGRGIHVQFQDITTELGVPAYQCFVTGRDGSIARATGANLNGARAALAALTETPWPYAYASGKPTPSGPGLSGLPTRYLEDLPDYSLASPVENCRLLEGVLAAHGKGPLYVDLSRADFDLPVVRALVPGLELTAEWERFSRPSLRLFARYAVMFA